MCHVSLFTCHVSLVTCHVSHVRCHVSGVRCLLSTGPTPSSLFMNTANTLNYREALCSSSTSQVPKRTPQRELDQHPSRLRKVHLRPPSLFTPPCTPLLRAAGHCEDLPDLHLASLHPLYNSSMPPAPTKTPCNFI